MFKNIRLWFCENTLSFMNSGLTTQKYLALNKGKYLMKL